MTCVNYIYHERSLIHNRSNTNTRTQVRKWLNRREYEVLPRFVELSSRQRERARSIILSVKGREHAYWFKGTQAELEMKDSTIMSVRCLGVLQDGRVLVSSVQTSRAMICEAKALRYREKNDVVLDTESTTMSSYRKLFLKAMQRDVKDWYVVFEREAREF